MTLYIDSYQSNPVSYGFNLIHMTPSKFSKELHVMTANILWRRLFKIVPCVRWLNEDDLQGREGGREGGRERDGDREHKRDREGGGVA